MSTTACTNAVVAIFVLLSEVEGVGKGLLARILSRILGYENVNENANYKHLTNTHNTLLIGTQVLVLNEVSLGDFKSKSEGTNSLKNFVADPFYTCNFKGKPMIKLPNLTNFMLFSNDPRVLQINDGARRYFFCNINKTEEEIICLLLLLRSIASPIASVHASSVRSAVILSISG